MLLQNDIAVASEYCYEDPTLAICHPNQTEYSYLFTKALFSSLMQQKTIAVKEYKDTTKTRADNYEKLKKIGILDKLSKMDTKLGVIKMAMKESAQQEELIALSLFEQASIRGMCRLINYYLSRFRMFGTGTNTLKVTNPVTGKQESYP